MRHSRKTVMAERYKIYLKKNILNGKYFKRNLEIAVCFVAVVALVIGLVAVGSVASEEEVITADASVSIKDALFGNSEDTKSVNKTETDTEAIVTEADTEATTEIVVAQTPTVSDYIQMSNEYKEAQENKSEFEGKCIANVEETLNIRKEPSTDAEFAGSMVPGAIAIVEGTEGDWTKIKSGDVEGYVLSEFVLTGESAEEFAANYVTLRGTALEDGVNVREDKSTDANILLVLNKDDTIEVLEKPEDKDDVEDDIKQSSSENVTTEGTTSTQSTETATEKVSETTSETSTEVTSEISTQNTSETVSEQPTTQNVTTETTTETIKKLSQSKETSTKEITWVPVILEDGKTGYVSSEFIEIEELYEIAVSAEELERLAKEEAERKAAEEEAARQAAQAAAAAAATASQSNSNSSNGGSSNNNSYQGATTTPVTTAEPGDLIGTFTITAYCGCSKCSGGNNKTASGTTPTEGRTIAADTSILPFGTQVVIDGVVYTVEDRGSGVSGNHIDIFFATHKKALAFGRKSIKVYKY